MTEEEQKAAQFLIVVYRVEDTTDGLIRSACHAKFGPETWEKVRPMMVEVNKLKKDDPNLIVNLIRL
jgi:hypothetical protein